MIQITPKLVKEIAETLSMGLDVHIHKETGQLVSLPDSDDMAYTDEEAWKEELDTLERDPEAYYQIERWSSREAYEIMESFAHQVPDAVMQEKLFDALDRRRPFRNFRDVLEDSEHYLQQWYDFEARRQQDYVKKELEWIISAEDNE